MRYGISTHVSPKHRTVQRVLTSIRSDIGIATSNGCVLNCLSHSAPCTLESLGALQSRSAQDISTSIPMAARRLLLSPLHKRIPQSTSRHGASLPLSPPLAGCTCPACFSKYFLVRFFSHGLVSLGLGLDRCCCCCEKGVP